MALQGMAEMVARMNNLRGQVSGPIAKKAVRAGGNVIRDAMIEHTPVLIEKNAGSNSLPPGAVKADIKVRFPAQEQVLETTALIGPGSKTKHVARFVEYGHRMVSGGQSKVLASGKLSGPGKASSKDVSAHPFLRPAYEEVADAAQQAEADVLQEELQKARV